MTFLFIFLIGIALCVWGLVRGSAIARSWSPSSATAFALFWMSLAGCLFGIVGLIGLILSITAPLSTNSIVNRTFFIALMGARACSSLVFLLHLLLYALRAPAPQSPSTRQRFLAGVPWVVGILSVCIAAFYLARPDVFASGHSGPNPFEALLIVAWLVLASAGVIVSVALLRATFGHSAHKGRAAALTSLALNLLVHPYFFLFVVEKAKSVRTSNVTESRQRAGGFQESGHANAIAFSPNGETVASTHINDVTLWDIASGKMTATLRGHKGVVSAIVFTPDGHMLVSASDDRTVRLWNIEKEAQEHRFAGHLGYITALAISSDGRTAASGDSEGIVKRWDLHARVEGPAMAARSGPISSVAFSPGDNTLAIASGDGLTIWDPAAVQALPALQESSGPFRCVAFTHDGRRLVAGGGNVESESGTLCLWDLATKQKRQVFQGHTKMIESLSLSADDQYLATSGWDATVRIWNVDSGDEITLRRHAAQSDHVIVAFSPSGKTLAVADANALTLLDVHNTTQLRSAGFTLTGSKDVAVNAAPIAAEKQPDKTAAPVADQSRDGRTRMSVEVLPPEAKPKNPVDRWRNHFDAVTWTLLSPSDATANGGTTFRHLQDGSLLVEGPNPSSSSYRIVSRPTLKRIMAVRLDVLRHDTLPNKGPGRHENGTFVLTGVRILQETGGGRPPRFVPVKLAIADYVQREHNLDGLGSGGKGPGSWAIYRVDSPMRDQSLVLELAEPVEIARETTFEVVLDCASEWQTANIGRFRLSVTDAIPAGE